MLDVDLMVNDINNNFKSKMIVLIYLREE